MQAPLQARNGSDATQTDTARTVTQKRLLADNRPEAVASRKLAEMMNNSPRVLQQRALSDAIHNSPRMVAQRHQMNALFGGAVKPQGDRAMPAEASPVQREEKPNNTGLPNQLKSGIESLSGMSMDHVKVHYNSDKPAQLQAHAYAQGGEIHVGPGQEKHLPHEAWHVVQQAHGRVRATIQMAGVGINDDGDLEREADVMGARAAMQGMGMMEQSGVAPAQLSLAQRRGSVVAQHVAGSLSPQSHSGTTASSSDRGTNASPASSFQAPTQLYREVRATGQNMTKYMVDDDTTMAVRKNDNQKLWLTQAVLDQSNQALDGKEAGLRLVKGISTNFTFAPYQAREFFPVTHRLDDNSTHITEGSDTDIPDDCGNACSTVLTGHSEQTMEAIGSQGNFITDGMDNDPMRMKLDVYSQMARLGQRALESEGKREDGVDQAHFGQMALESEGKREDGVDQALSDLATGLAAIDGHKQAWANWSASNHGGNADLDLAVAHTLTRIDTALHSVGLRDQLHAKHQINERANPAVGEGLTISTGGPHVEGKDTWEFHWGAAIAKSPSGSDYVTLENYANPKDPEGQQSRWNYDMYGTQRMKPEQTFHGKHLATKLHGAAPTTLRIGAPLEAAIEDGADAPAEAAMKNGANALLPADKMIE
jgi:hypothetical protein